ncbi:MAG: holin family protein [Pseudomonadota bacterium]
MGVITDFLGMLFGSHRNVLAETIEVFRENAENAGVRESEAQAAALHQFSAEFRHARRGWFDRFIDGLNRLPRPLMAFGTLGLIGAALIAPSWFSARMTGLALVPEPLWWLMGAIVSFYFGARHQAKGQEFQQTIAQSLSVGPTRSSGRAKVEDSPNPALDAWRAEHGT